MGNSSSQYAERHSKAVEAMNILNSVISQTDVSGISLVKQLSRLGDLARTKKNAAAMLSDPRSFQLLSCHLESSNTEIQYKTVRLIAHMAEHPDLILNLIKAVCIPALIRLVASPARDTKNYALYTFSRAALKNPQAAKVLHFHLHDLLEQVSDHLMSEDWLVQENASLIVYGLLLYSDQPEEILSPAIAKGLFRIIRFSSQSLQPFSSAIQGLSILASSSEVRKSIANTEGVLLKIVEGLTPAQQWPIRCAASNIIYEFAIDPSFEQRIVNLDIADLLCNLMDHEKEAVRKFTMQAFVQTSVSATGRLVLIHEIIHKCIQNLLAQSATVREAAAEVLITLANISIHPSPEYTRAVIRASAVAIMKNFLSSELARHVAHAATFFWVVSTNPATRLDIRDAGLLIKFQDLLHSPSEYQRMSACRFLCQMAQDPVAREEIRRGPVISKLKELQEFDSEYIASPAAEALDLLEYRDCEDFDRLEAQPTITDSFPSSSVTQVLPRSPIEQESAPRVVPQTPSSAERSEGEKGLCVICMDQPATAGFLHGRSVHLCSCLPCANNFMAGEGSKLCPMCRKPVDLMLEHVFT